MKKKTVRDIDVRGKRVLVRVDFNVDMREGQIADDGRIRAVLPTIRYLREQKARVILCSHLGRPGGKVDEALRLTPVAHRMEAITGLNVHIASDCIGSRVEEAVAKLKPGDLLLLENLRFHPEEEKNDPGFAKALASLAEVFVNDGFAVAHRAHASTVGVTHYLPSVAGFLLERELKVLGSVLESPERPLVAILGGAKVSDKIGVLENFVEIVDALLIGGGMAATFLKARGLPVGSSRVEDDRLEFARGVMARAAEKGVTFHLPGDVVIATAIGPGAESRAVNISEVPQGWYIVDIGPRTLALFKKELARGKTVLWNGPMGVFEVPAFAKGTQGLATALAALDGATTIVGGGSTAEAVDSLGLEGKMKHVSTGGGASLDFLGGKTLPGVASLLDRSV